MGTVQFSHTVPQIDAAVDSINVIAQRLGVTAILPMPKSDYDALALKDGNTLYIAYSDTKFELFYGTRPLSGGGGGASAGSFAPLLVGGSGAAGRLTAPEPI